MQHKPIGITAIFSGQGRMTHRETHASHTFFIIQEKSPQKKSVNLRLCRRGVATTATLHVGNLLPCDHTQAGRIKRYSMNWIILIVAGLFESGFAFCLGKMKATTGSEYYLWCAGFIVCLILSMVLLAKAVQTLPIGTAYPIWTGIGAVGTVILGIVFFHEPATFARLFFITTLIASIIGLKMVSH